MPEKVFLLTSERSLEASSLQDVHAASDQASPCWIDVNERESAPLGDLLRSLGLHPLAIEACLDPMPVSRLVAYGKVLFIALPTLRTWEAGHRTFLWIVCSPGIIVTIREAKIPALENIVQHYRDGMRFHSENISAILYQILDYIIDEDMAFTLRTRDAVDRLDELLDERADDALTVRALPLKRQLARLAATFEDQLYCVSTLQTIESDAFSMDGLHDYFRDAVSHLEHATRSIGRQLTRLNTVQQEYQLRLQDRTNDRLRLLTVISTVFLPLMLITGIYGMNFRNMPELDWPYSYFGVLTAMVAIAGAMLWGFSRAGWFR